MRVIDKLNMDSDLLLEYGAVNIVAFGDSITHGALSGENDYETVYWNRLKKKLNSYCNDIPVNIINSGIGGTTATKSIARIERDVLSHHPDLAIVCFGLNDVCGELTDYIGSLRLIFQKCKDADIDVIYMTPNMLNTYVAADTAQRHLAYAAKTADIQNGGKMDLFINEAKKLASEMGVAVCDCYSEWKKLYESGEDTTMLLANRINHPKREMHKLFADKLYDIIITNA